MPKVQLTDLASLANETTAIEAINDNNAAIEGGFNNTISRDGTSPNTMEAQLDMNNNRLVNVPLVPLSNADVATKYYVDYRAGDIADATPTNPSDAVIEGNLDVGAGIDVTGDLIVTGDVTASGVINGWYYDSTNDRAAIGVEEFEMDIAGGSIPSKVAVHTDGTEAALELHSHDTGSGLLSSPIIYGARSDGTEASESIVLDNDYLFSIAATGYDGTDYAQGARIDFRVDGTPGAGDMPTEIIFSTSADGSESPTARMSLTSNGGIDLPEISEPASPSANISRAFAFDVNGVTHQAAKDSGGRVRLLTSTVADIIEFGAVIDGSTDDATAVQAALDAALAAGGNLVFMPAGTTIIGSTLTIGSGVTLAGAGWSSILKLDDGADVDMIQNENFGTDVSDGGDDSIIIRDFKIDGNRANQTGGADVHGIAFDAPDTNRNTRLLLQNLWVTACEGHGIHPKGTDYLKVQNVISDLNGVTGDQLFHNFYLLRCDHLDIRGLQTANVVAGRGVKITNCSYGYLQIEDLNSADDGIAISGDCQFLRCDLFARGATNHGVQVVNETSLPERLSLNIVAEGCGGNGLDMAGGQSSITGIFQNNTGSGINVSGDKNVFTGIRSRSNDVGMNIDAAADGTIVVGNSLQNNTTSQLVDGGTNTVNTGNAT